MKRLYGRLRGLPFAEIRDGLIREAILVREEDIAINRAIGRHGAPLIPDGGIVLTHCNAGALATAGYGTALGVIRAAVEAGKKIGVYADETLSLIHISHYAGRFRARNNSPPFGIHQSFHYRSRRIQFIAISGFACRRKPVDEKIDTNS